MAVLAEQSLDITDDRLAARNALILAAAQALAGGNNTVIVATGGIAGAILAPDPVLATLPISLMVVGMWIGTLPVGMLAKAFGRRFALQVGSAFGVLSGVISCAAMLSGSFFLLLAGTLCGGFYAAAHQSYRFAATDTASVHFRARAVAWVLAGGVFCRGAGTADCHLHQGCLAGLFVRRDLFGAIGVRNCRRNRAGLFADTAASHPAYLCRRPAAPRYRQQAAIHRRRRLRNSQLRDDECDDEPRRRSPW